MMNQSRYHILTRHHLRHIPELKLRENFFAVRYGERCSMDRCTSSCCKFGVYADLDEKERILSHADLIRRYLEPHQEPDASRWFEEKIYDDPDFPSKKCVGTRALDYGCVFLDSSGRCALQKASSAEGLGRYYLKPFYCFAYPVTILRGELIVDDEEFLSNPGCCRPDSKGTRSIFDLCDEELRFVLGEEGYSELRTIYSGRERDTGT
ncbi:MAG TPA: DUF3109 family protein [Bacteroidota bacterium]|nr:DUF3109 family protein [Bacteroidota bacterium]